MAPRVDSGVSESCCLFKKKLKLYIISLQTCSPRSQKFNYPIFEIRREGKSHLPSNKHAQLSAIILSGIYRSAQRDARVY